jgi:hypothetical protein
MSNTQNKQTINIYKKLAKVKAGLKIKKNRQNEYAGFWYTSLDFILEEVNQLLLDNDLSFNIVEYNDNGDKTYTIKAILIDSDSDQTIDFNYILHGAVITTKGKGESFDDFVYKIQDSGSAITYITRYVYGLVFSIPFEDYNIQKNTANKEYKPAKTFDKPKIEVWMSQEQFDNLIESTDSTLIETVLSSKQTKEGKTFGMKKEYRQKLTEKLNNL